MRHRSFKLYKYPHVSIVRRYSFLTLLVSSSFPLQMSPKHHILLLGGTGLCGQIFARAALNAGHQLTLYARSPSKLSTDLAEHPNLAVIQGELNDVEGLSKAGACGADVFISVAGPTLGKREGTVCFCHFPSLRKEC